MDIVTKDIEKIYFDMDGVLVDFWGGLHDMCGEVDTENFDDVWDAVRSVEHFYSKLEPIDGAIDLINSFIEKYGNKCEILTAIPPESKNIKYAAEDKREWVSKYINDNINVNVVVRIQKKELCKGKGCILIDDYHKNIEDWENCGGTAIFFENVQQIEELFLRD